MLEAEDLAKNIYESTLTKDWESIISNSRKLLQFSKHLSEGTISKIHFALAVAFLNKEQYSKTYENLTIFMKTNSGMKEDGEFLFKILKYEIMKND